MQSFAPKCLHGIIIGEDDNGETGNISNWYLRYDNNIPTTHSQKSKDKICDIYRWETSISPSYSNNINRRDSQINKIIIYGGE